jgi:pantoate kinase
MKKSVTAFCPGHISGYFLPVLGDDPATTGSLGAGMVIQEGVSVRVTPSEDAGILARRIGPHGVILEEFQESPPLSYLAGKFPGTFRIETTCRLPIGAGFGLSAAALMASAFALNVLCRTGFTFRQCCQYAHEAEIVHRTGLGDVAACQDGGRDYRLGPGVGAEIIRYYDLRLPVYAVTFGPLLSPGILGSEKAIEQITGAYPDRWPASPEEFFRLSRTFAEGSGLMSPAVHEVLSDCDREGVYASMTMLGNGVFGLGKRAAEVLGSYGDVFELWLASAGVRVTGEGA